MQLQTNLIITLLAKAKNFEIDMPKLCLKQVIITLPIERHHRFFMNRLAQVKQII